MAFEYGFGPGPVIDPATGQVVTSASLQAFAAAEGGDPLTVRVAGVEVTEVQAGSDGMVQQFFAEYGKVYVEAPGVTRFMLTSPDDLLAAAETARDAAQAAAADAELAAGQVLPVGGSAGMVLAKRTSADRDVMWVLQTGGGGGGGGSVLIWRYQGGGYPDLTPTRPDGVITVEAQGPSQPSNVPDWVGLSPSQATLLYTFVPLS